MESSSVKTKLQVSSTLPTSFMKFPVPIHSTNLMVYAELFIISIICHALLFQNFCLFAFMRYVD